MIIFANWYLTLLRLPVLVLITQPYIVLKSIFIKETYLFLNFSLSLNERGGVKSLYFNIFAPVFFHFLHIHLWKLWRLLYRPIPLKLGFWSKSMGSGEGRPVQQAQPLGRYAGGGGRDWRCSSRTDPVWSARRYADSTGNVNFQCVYQV